MEEKKMISKFEQTYMRIISEMNMTDSINTNNIKIKIDGLDDNDYYSDGYRQCDDYSYMDNFYDESEIYDIHDDMFLYKGIILDANFDEPDYMKININATVDGSSINVLAYTAWEKIVDNSKNREFLFNAKSRKEFEKIFYSHKVIDFVNQYKFIKIDGIHAVEIDGEDVKVKDFINQYPELYNQIMGIDPTEGKNVVFGWDQTPAACLTFRTV